VLELRLSRARFLAEPKREANKMPLLLYFPLIVWMGMAEILQQEMQAPVRAKTQSRQR
jgi:hypothetical protein